MSYRVVGHMIGRTNDGRTNDGRTNDGRTNDGRTNDSAPFFITIKQSISYDIAIPNLLCTYLHNDEFVNFICGRIFTCHLFIIFYHSLGLVTCDGHQHAARICKTIFSDLTHCAGT